MTLYPTNTDEEAVEAVLRTLRRARDGFLEDLRAGERDAGTLASQVEDLGRAARQLGARWKHLDRDSPYRWEALEEAIKAIEAVDAAAVEAGPEIKEIVELESDLADLLTLDARLDVAAAIGVALDENSTSARKAAKASGVSYSYLSELRGAKGTLPLPDISDKLDQLLGTSLTQKVEASRQRIEALRQEAKALRGRRARRGATLPTLRGHARIQAVVARLADDQGVLELVEDVIALPEAVRRTIHNLATELRDTLA